jgi:hypothetical protein
MCIVVAWGGHNVQLAAWIGARLLEVKVPQLVKKYLTSRII